MVPCLTLQGALQKGIYPINIHYIRCIWGWLLRVPSQGYQHFSYDNIITAYGGHGWFSGGFLDFLLVWFEVTPVDLRFFKGYIRMYLVHVVIYHGILTSPITAWKGCQRGMWVTRVCQQKAMDVTVALCMQLIPHSPSTSKKNKWKGSADFMYFGRIKPTEIAASCSIHQWSKTLGWHSIRVV